MNKLLLALLAVILLSCGHGYDSFSVGKFRHSPVDSFGVGCYFFESEKDTDVVLSSDLDSLCYILLNDELTAFKLTKRVENYVNDSIINYTDTYIYKTFELTVEAKQTGHIDYTGLYKGTLKVKNKSGKIIVKQFTGSCGC